MKFFYYTLLAIVTIILLAFAYFNLPGPSPREDVKFGMTFSSRYAESLGLDWWETYIALLDDMGVKKLRLPVYWDLAEKEKGEYDFSDLDWQLVEAEKRGAEVILVLGQRVPRWPECHIPTWANESEEKRKSALLNFMGRTVNRYKNNPTVLMWQVENEPFLVFFGVCPKFDKNFLDQEIALVKSLDPNRKVLTTDSGELSLWYSAAKRGDVFGTTLYRHIYKSGVGYFTYPIGPNFFKTKEWLVRLFTNQENFIVIELQAEPWTSQWITDVPLPEQFRTMDETKLKENADYAKRVGFPEVYLWGGEWWYWLKVKKNYPAVWETGRELFQENK
jgi:hypothetical protein